MINSVNKQPIDESFKFIFPEEIAERSLMPSVIKNVFTTTYLYYASVAQLDKHIVENFGITDKYFSYYSFNPKTGKFQIDEKAFVYKTFIIVYKQRGVAYDPDEYENSEEEISDEDKFDTKIRISLFSTSLEFPEDLKNKFEKICSTKTELKRKFSEISILCHSTYEGFYLKNVKTINTEVDLKNNYNDDFTDVSNYIIERLNTQDDKGIVFLHGIPGTGKCVAKNTKIKIRNKQTQQVEEIEIGEFYSRLR